MDLMKPMHTKIFPNSIFIIASREQEENNANSNTKIVFESYTHDVPILKYQNSMWKWNQNIRKWDIVSIPYLKV